MSQPHELLYSLHDKPPFWACLTAAVQHVLASFIGIVTPTLIIGGVLGLGSEVPYLISMALIASGLSTLIQTRRFGPLGSGLMAVQGTSFAFISALLIAGTTIKNRGGSNDDILAMMLGLTCAGALVEIALSQFINKLKRIINPLTTGIVITAIGLSLIKVGMTDLAGGFNAEGFASMQNLAIGMSVLLLIIFLNACHNQWLRLSAIAIGMVAGTLYCWATGIVSFSQLSELPVLTVPIPFKYGIDFEWSLFLPIALIYLFTAIETAGDLTANSLFCKEPIKGPVYLRRIKGGILADGFNSLMAGALSTFPNTTFGQNNGVIQMTGVASRTVGFFIAAIFVFLGFFPIIGGVFQAIPKPVLGGATLMMFAMVAVGGLKILTSHPMDRRNSLITACSLGMGIGVMMVPTVLNELPQWLANVLASPVTTAGLSAVILDLTMPGKSVPATSTQPANAIS